MKSVVAPITIGSQLVRPGTLERLEIPVARLFTGNWLSLPVAVLHGARPGPRLWLSAALHGDELNGMEIIREALQGIDPKRLRGTIVAVPVVNVFGFLNQSRYLPDRRDLNRSFPGSAKGSLASRLAQLFLQEVVEKCEYGIDFHTGSQHRENLAHIRAHLDDPETRRLAEAFNAPFVYEAPLIHGSLRATASKLGVRLLLFEGGEPTRFNRDAIAVGVRGTRRVLDALGMWPDDPDAPPVQPSFQGTSTRWLRAGRSGVFQRRVELGERVQRGQLLGLITRDFFSAKMRAITAPFDSLVICCTKNPLVNQGDALMHLAEGVELAARPFEPEGGPG